MKTKRHRETRTFIPLITRRHIGARVALGLAIALWMNGASAQEVIVSEDAGVRTVYTTFEGGGHQAPIAPDTDGWIPGAGMRFAGDWVTLTHPLGIFANNPSGDAIATWESITTGQVVEFAEPVSEVFFHYSGRQGLNLEALDASGNVIASVFRPSNGLNFMRWDPLSVQLTHNLIAAVRITGQGGGRTGVDDFGYRRLPEIEVPIDVKPSNENEIDPINLKAKGSLPLAVFSTPDFDATTLDVSTLQLGDPNLVQIATVVWGSAEDLNDDGLLDVVLHFSASELIDGGALTADTTELLLTGGTTDGKSILGTDQVRIVGGGN